jgi:penicillin-binding protein A
MTGIYQPDRSGTRQPSWKAYQERLRRGRERRPEIRLTRRAKLLAAVLVTCAALLWMVFPSGDRLPDRGSPTLPDRGTNGPSDTLIGKSDVRIFLDGNHLMNVDRQPVAITFDGRPYQVETSIDLELQRYLIKKMDRVNSRYIGIVVMAPDTGRILTMAGFNKIDPDQDPCLTADYPAASLFKIVTAAAAVEKKGYTAGTHFNYNGYKHTLYKRQLTDTTNRYTNSTSLKSAFAESVNPVFGKLGALYLDRQTLERYGERFGFNRDIGFELPWTHSTLSVDDDSYHRAEIASGFNRRTRMSPLHGAVIVSAVVNDGKPVEPTLVQQILDDQGTPVYHSHPAFLPTAISAKTAGELERLMTATVTSGTARKPFRGYSRSKVLSQLRIGGKTGSIFNRAHDARFDWFVGFATEKKGSASIVVSVMVAHEEYIGTRAGQYARMAIEYYFKNYFARQTQAGTDSSG